MTASSDSTTSAPNAWDSPRLPLLKWICVHLIPHDFQWLTPDLLTLSPMHASAVVVRAGFRHPLDHYDAHQKGFPMSEMSTKTVICGMETLFKYVN